MITSSVVVWLSALFLASVSGQDIVSDCPVPNGYFADSLQCDKYYECIDDILTEKLCPDGMAFNDLNHRVEKCDFIYQIDCSSRPDLQPPQVSDNCPRANGYFPHTEPGRCNEFYYCSAGTGNHLNCPESLVFSLKTGTCVWPDEAGRTDDCKGSEVVNFTCPSVPSHEAVAHPRYADPLDCQYFYVCINGKTPRRNGCKFGEVFSSELGACDSPKMVPECSEYYFDFFTDYFANLGTQVPSNDILNAALSSGFKVPEVAKRVRVRPSGITSADGTPIRRRRPTVSAAATETADAPAPRVTIREPVPKPAASQPARPVRRRRPSLSLSRRTTTPAPTTTTTTPPPPPPPPAADGAEYPEYDYYYDDYAPGEEAAPAAPAPTTTTEAPTTRRASLANRLLPRRRPAARS